MKIGFLFPYSGFFPELKEDFRCGFECALTMTAPEICPVVLGEFIQMGDLKSVEPVLKKLLSFERVDLVMGIVGNNVTAACIPTIAKQETPVIIHNLGGHLPGPYLSSPYLFYNSLHVWKSEWAIGKWAQATYGGVPSVSLSMYESGYHLLECFKVGVGASGAGNLTLNMLRNIDGPTDTMPLIRHLEEQLPFHNHVLLSGAEGAQFLEYFQDRQLSVALTTHPFLDGGTHATTWTRHLETSENQTFINHYEVAFGAPPHAFSMLGYESGLAVAAALHAIDGNFSRAKLAAALTNVRPSGPRGPIALSTQPLRAEQLVYLCRGGEVIAEIPAVSLDDPCFAALQGVPSGWVNPYLCV